MRRCWHCRANILLALSKRTHSDAAAVVSAFERHGSRLLAALEAACVGRRTVDAQVTHPWAHSLAEQAILSEFCANLISQALFNDFALDAFAEIAFGIVAQDYDDDDSVGSASDRADARADAKVADDAAERARKRAEFAHVRCLHVFPSKCSSQCVLWVAGIRPRTRARLRYIASFLPVLVLLAWRPVLMGLSVPGRIIDPLWKVQRYAPLGSAHVCHAHGSACPSSVRFACVYAHAVGQAAGYPPRTRVRSVSARSG